MEKEVSSQNNEPDQSGMGWYIFGAVLILVGLAGVIVMGVYGVKGVMNTGDKLHRFKIPGSHELQLEKSGTYTVYHEHTSQLDGEMFRTGGTDLNNYKFTLHPKNEPDREISMTSGNGSSSYEFGNRKGTSLFTFTVDKPGKYVFQARKKNRENTGRSTAAVITVGQNILWKLFKNIGLIMGGGCFFLVFIGGGLAVIIIRLVS